MLLLAVYSAGLGIPFLLAGWSIEFFFGAFQRMRRHFRTRRDRRRAGSSWPSACSWPRNRLAVLNDYFLFLSDVVETAEQALL